MSVNVPVLARRADGGFDAAVVLAAVLAICYALPARLTVSGMGAAGRPVLVLGLGLLLWWCTAKLIPGFSVTGTQPVRVALGLFLAVDLLCYALGAARGIPTVEASSADRRLLVTLAYLGVALVVADGMTSRRRLDIVLKALVFGAMFMAVIAHVQFLLHIEVTSAIRIPGLVAHGDFVGLSRRGFSFNRVAGTAGHYIEFGVLMALVVPIALHYVLHSTGWRRFVFALATGVITTGCLISVSRSAIVTLAVVLCLMLPAYSFRGKLNAVVAGLVFLVAVRFVQPGLLGTLRSLFEAWNNDPSISGRTSDYQVVAPFIAERPWFGRGPGTFMPERYLFLDNEWLGRVIETGIVGTLALLLVFATGFVLAKRVGRWAETAEDRHLGHAIAAAIFASVLAGLTFDSLSFAGFGTTTFLLIGAAGALWRLCGQPRPLGLPVTPALPAPTFLRAAREPAALLPAGRRPWA